MLEYLVGSQVRLRLLRLLWVEGATGSVMALACRAGTPYGATHRELHRMERAGLATSVGAHCVKEWHANRAHAAGAALTTLLGDPHDTMPPREDSHTLRSELRGLGAPLLVAPARYVPDRELALVLGVELSRRHGSVARALPAAFWRQRDAVDWARLTSLAGERRLKHPLGFLLDLTATLSADRSLHERARVLRDHRVRQLSDFFLAPQGRYAQKLADERTPKVARRWFYRLNLDMASFQKTFQEATA